MCVASFADLLNLASSLPSCDRPPSQLAMLYHLCPIGTSCLKCGGVSRGNFRRSFPSWRLVPSTNSAFVCMTAWPALLGMLFLACSVGLFSHSFSCMFYCLRWPCPKPAYASLPLLCDETSRAQVCSCRERRTFAAVGMWHGQKARGKPNARTAMDRGTKASRRSAFVVPAATLHGQRLLCQEPLPWAPQAIGDTPPARLHGHVLFAAISKSYQFPHDTSTLCPIWKPCSCGSGCCSCSPKGATKSLLGSLVFVLVTTLDWPASTRPSVPQLRAKRNDSCAKALAVRVSCD